MKDLRDMILNVKDLKMEKIKVPGWGFDVYIKQLSGKEQDMYEQASHDDKGEMRLVNARARFVAAALVDKEGNRLFEPKDYEMLSEKSGASLNFIIDKIHKLNRITMDDIETMAKN